MRSLKKAFKRSKGEKSKEARKRLEKSKRRLHEEKRLKGKEVIRKSKQIKRKRKLKMLTLARVLATCAVCVRHSSHPRPSHRDEHGCAVECPCRDPPVCS